MRRPQNNRREHGAVLAARGLAVLLPSLLGGLVLLFGTRIRTYATAAAMAGSTVQLVTLQIADACPATSWSGRRTSPSPSAWTWC